MNGIDLFADLSARFPALMRRAYGADAFNAFADEQLALRAQHVATEGAEAAQAAGAEQAEAARLEAIEHRLDAAEARTIAARDRVRATRKREIAREYRALRDEGHDRAYAQQYAVYNVDSAARWAAQTAAHQARQAAAAAEQQSQTAAPKLPALVVVRRFDNQDLQDIVAGFGTRINT